MKCYLFPISIAFLFALPAYGFFVAQNNFERITNLDMISTPLTDQSNNNNKSYLHVPNERDAHYGAPLNECAAQYLVDLHDAKSAFNFCGGMMFQLVLSEKLREHLIQVVANDKNKNKVARKLVVHDASKMRMFQIPDYEQHEIANNIQIFHGREIRQVSDATGGMGFVLQLSLASSEDPEGWTNAEVAGYDGWKHDVGRQWRKGELLEEEGFVGFKARFGEKAFALHHRFYLHLDAGDRLWLSAEDGCEGTPAEPVSSSDPVSKLFGWLGSGQQ